ncbi:MAG: hypothetical protein AAF711_10625 [Planctomycetota bacterium]
MSEDEILFLIVHSIAGLIVLGCWYLKAPEIKHFGRPIPGLGWYYLAPVLCFGLVTAGLQLFAASDVRNTFYVVWYVIMWLAWVGITVIFLLPLVGLRLYDDVLERRNPAVMIASLGAMLGLTLAYLGGNFGEGPSWGVVALCTLISFGGFFGLWLLVAMASPVLQRLTIERDLGTAIRVFGLLTGFGVVLGRAVAGDWVSVEGTFEDFFLIAWVLILLAVFEIVLARFASISRKLDVNAVTLGVVPGCLYFALGAGYVVGVGWW